MSLDPNQEAQLTELVNSLTPNLSQAASALLGSQITIQFDGVAPAMTSATSIQPGQEMVIAHVNLSGSKLNLLLTSSDASAIAALMTGSEAAATEFTGATKEAFVSAMTQVLGQGLNGNDKLSLDTASLDTRIIDPADPASLDLAELGGQEKLALSFGISTESGLTMNIQAELIASLADTLLGTATVESSPGTEEPTVGDVFGADFREIVDSHNPDEVDEKKNLNLLMDINLGLIVELGRSEMQLRDILKLTKGSIIELDRLSGEPVDLFANNKLVARGEVVVIDDNFGLRITQLAGLNSQSELSLLTGEAD